MIVQTDNGDFWKRLKVNLAADIIATTLVKIHVVFFFRKLEEAAQFAFEQRDVQSLLNIQSKCAVKSALSEKINNLIIQLGTKK